MNVLLEGVVWVLAEEDVEIQDAPYRPVRNGRVRRGLQRHLYKQKRTFMEQICTVIPWTDECFVQTLRPYPLRCYF